MRPLRLGEILLRVRATSVNPIDCMRRAGYGRKLLGLAGAAQLPLILGNDVAGEVEQVLQDPAAKKKHSFAVGDKVFGALPPASDGSYASHCIARPEWLQPVPDGLSFEQAGSLPYAALTCFAAFRSLHLNAENAAGKNVLVQGGSGGVGTVATQLLSAWGARVTTLSSAENLAYCREQGAAEALDYGQIKLGDLENFDAVLAAFGLEDTEHFRPRLLKWGGYYTTLRHPLLNWSDRYGVLPGGVAAVSLYWTRQLRWARSGRHYRWSLFSVNNNGMRRLSEAIVKGQVKAVVQQSLPLQSVAEAHRTSEAGHVRGKLVLTLP